MIDMTDSSDRFNFRRGAGGGGSIVSASLRGKFTGFAKKRSNVCTVYLYQNVRC